MGKSFTYLSFSRGSLIIKCSNQDIKIEDASIIGPFAVHKDPSKDNWIVTHIRSGLAVIINVKSIGSAKLIALNLANNEKLCWNFGNWKNGTAGIKDISRYRKARADIEEKYREHLIR